MGDEIMIYTNLNDEKQIKALHPKFQECITFIKNNDIINNFKEGIYEIGELDVKMHYDNYYSKEKSKGFWESHKKYIDIQILLEGEEFIYLNNIYNLTKKSENIEKDLIIFEGKELFKISFKKNDILIFFPEDAHMPGIKTKKTTFNRKIVFKIKVDTL